MVTDRPARKGRGGRSHRSIVVITTWASCTYALLLAPDPLLLHDPIPPSYAATATATGTTTASSICSGSASILFCGKSWPRDTTQLQCYQRAGLGADVKALDLSPLACLTLLRDLSLVSGEIEFIQALKLGSLAPLSGLHALQQLSLEETDVTDVRPLAGLKQLRRLSLHHSQVIDVQPLHSLDAMEDLDLSCTRIADLRPLRALKRLQRIDLTGTPIDDLSPLKDLPQLRWLGLREDKPALREQAQALRKDRPDLLISVGRAY